MSSRSRVFAVVNQKGGVGKTTTAVNLAACLAVSERPTLLIDLDPQANASSAYGVVNTTRQLYHALIGDCVMKDAVIPTELRFLQVVPSGRDLVGAEIELVETANRERRLEMALADLRDAYEFVVIDCPPSLGILTLNALVAADSILIPLQCEYYALEGLARLLETVELVRGGLNPSLTLEGIVLTMMDQRNNLSRQVEEEVRRHFGERVYQTAIPRNVRLSEAPSHGKPILLYDIHSRGAVAYLRLTEEILGAARGVPFTQSIDLDVAPVARPEEATRGPSSDVISAPDSDADAELRTQPPAPDTDRPLDDEAKEEVDERTA